MDLGLAIVQNIIEQHDGQIYASNIEPHGARVTIELSIIASHRSLKWNEETSFGKILIIDDEKDNTEIIKDILEDVNYKTVLARSAREAKIIVAANTFDLVLMDVWMPGQDGISLLEEWISEGFDTPIVMMSGHAEPSDIVSSNETWCNRFSKEAFA